ncbi:cell wall-binding repeat-containing protein [Candidatus Poriferisodalis sp.]|uniref:cell wall-binding repeat-containing protein n=1 Tax=Candidatus Poriferisodalis sp. TaxID=3101277 RepID=UPI003AF81994
MLMASVLAVVAGSPAQAANTSSEVLVDHDDDAATAAVREFGGRDRYDTALRLANNFGRAKGLGNVSTAFVASGLALVDAVSVAGLAGFLDAPVLLTSGDSLHGGVADFIEDYGVQTVYILGGAGAVSDEVAEDIEALANEPTVSRIEGADRYATAAAAASKLGGGAAWCGAEDPAAILANGGDVSLVEAMAVGPIAHRLQLPLLLTAADELSMATADFIEAEDIEHVVIVGGTDSVSDAVATALSDSGVDTVERIAGDTPAGTSVALAELAHDGCSDDLAVVSPDMVALVSQDGLPDGVAAAPVLTSTFADQDLVPMLVVGDTLPASVRDYLAATPDENDAGEKVNLKIVAIGGAAAVSQSVVDAALAAAASADGLSVQIGATTDKNEDGDIDADDVPAPGDTAVNLYFSDDVIGEDALEGKIRDAMELNGAPARLAEDDEVTREGGDDPCNPDQVTVTFASELKAGDTVSVVGGFKLGASGDQRTVGGASLTIPAPAPDRTRPTISAIMIAGRETAEVTVSMDDPQLAVGTEVTLRNRTAGDDKTASVGADGNLDFTDPLVAGDRVTIPSGAIEDAAGNKSLQRSFTAIAPHKSPRITAVTMSNLKHSAQAATEVPTEIAGAAVTGDAGISITAKADGPAAGAVGNIWSMVFDVASTWEADPDAEVDIDVRVNSRDRAVFVRFNTGDAKFGDLKAALEGNSAFDAMFAVKLPPNEADDAGCNATLNQPLDIGNDDRQIGTGLLDGGMTQVAIEVRFNGYVEEVTDTGLLEDILKDVVDRDNGLAATADVTGALTLGSPATFVGPKTTVRYEAITSNAAALPQVRDLVTTAAGADAVTDNADTAADAVAAIATGYAPEAEADETHNDEKNAASQVRIGRSSGVMVPPTPEA